MNHSDYDIVRVEHDRVFIVDLDLGNKSVTNDAERVYSELKKHWPGRRIIYKDSIGNWDEIIVQPFCKTNFVYITFKPYKEHLPKI
jgi:hypothetical protein